MILFVLVDQTGMCPHLELRGPEIQVQKTRTTVLIMSRTISLKRFSERHCEADLEIFSTEQPL